MVGTIWDKKKDLMNDIKEEIVEAYRQTGSPITTRTIMQGLKEPSWHTTQRYLEMMKTTHLIDEIKAPNGQIMWKPENIKELKKTDFTKFTWKDGKLEPVKE